MWRSLRSGFPENPESGRAAVFALVMLLLGLGVGAAPGRTETSADPEDACGPFPMQYAEAADRGGEPTRGLGASVAAAEDASDIIRLPAAEAPLEGSPVGGEALLALPKGPGGSIAGDEVELGPGAHVAESYWSPVLCSTLARIVGPPGSSLQELVPGVPDTATVVPHDRYVTVADEVRPLAEKPSGAQPDPYRGLQYGLDRLGVDAARAVTDGAGARVAILDSAPQVGHADLGSVSLLGEEQAPAATHGTLMVGIIGAVERNGLGIAGVAPGSQILAVPACRAEGATATDVCGLYDLLAGLDAAWEAEAQILNLSLVGPDNPLLERAMARLDELGAAVVAAAGNEGSTEPRYPAAYPTVVGVGAIGPDGSAYARSNRGPSVEIDAPGVEVLSTAPGDAFAFGDGTSLAAAHVSGVLALLVGSGATPHDARTAMFVAARPSGAAGSRTLAPVCDALGRLENACP